MTAFRKGRLQGLSCLKGNFHEQFLGGWTGAIPPGYPAGDSDIISLPNQLGEHCTRFWGGGITRTIEVHDRSPVDSQRTPSSVPSRRANSG